MLRFSDAQRFKFGFSGSRNGRFHFAHTCFNGLYAMTVSAVVGVFIPVIVLGIAELIVKLCFKSVFENLADHFLKYGFQVSEVYTISKEISNFSSAFHFA